MRRQQRHDIGQQLTTHKLGLGIAAPPGRICVTVYPLLGPVLDGLPIGGCPYLLIGRVPGWLGRWRRC